MKKLTAIIILNFVLFSCTTENELAYHENTSTVPEQTKRSLSEALGIAQEAASLFGNNSRSEKQRIIDMDNIQYLCSGIDSRSQDNDTLLYVVNYADNNGFAVVSANPNTAGLIAVTEKGSYSSTSEEINNNTGMDLFLNMAEVYVSNSERELQETETGIIKELIEYIDTTDTYIDSKISVSWGQTGHEGKFCPNGISGCVNTALAQIMTHFEYPTQIDITYEDAPISNLNLDWSEIKEYKSIYNDKATDSTHDAIGYLLRELGHLNKSNYLPKATSTYDYNALNTMSSLGYTVSSNLMNYENTSFLSALNDNYLVYMRGNYIEENVVKSGHAWIVDGHYQREIHYTAYTREEGSPLMELFDESYTYYNYNHINWEWDGSCNGYFLEDVFNTSDAHQYDGVFNFADYNFAVNLKYFLITK